MILSLTFRILLESIKEWICVKEFDMGLFSKDNWWDDLHLAELERSDYIRVDGKWNGGLKYV